MDGAPVVVYSLKPCCKALLSGFVPSAVLIE